MVHVLVNSNGKEEQPCGEESSYGTTPQPQSRKPTNRQKRMVVENHERWIVHMWVTITADRWAQHLGHLLLEGALVVALLKELHSKDPL